MYLWRVVGDHNPAKNLCVAPCVQVAWLCRGESPGYDMTIAWHVVGYCIRYGMAVYGRP